MKKFQLNKITEIFQVIKYYLMDENEKYAR